MYSAYVLSSLFLPMLLVGTAPVPSANDTPCIPVFDLGLPKEYETIPIIAGMHYCDGSTATTTSTTPSASTGANGQNGGSGITGGSSGLNGTNTTNPGNSGLGSGTLSKPSSTATRSSVVPSSTPTGGSGNTGGGDIQKPASLIANQPGNGGTNPNGKSGTVNTGGDNDDGDDCEEQTSVGYPPPFLNP